MVVTLTPYLQPQKLADEHGHRRLVEAGCRLGSDRARLSLLPGNDLTWGRGVVSSRVAWGQGW